MLLSAPAFVHSLGTAEQLHSGAASLDVVTTNASAAGHSIILELAMRPVTGEVSAYAHAPGSAVHLLDFHVDADMTATRQGMAAVRTVLLSAEGAPALSQGTVITFTFPENGAQAASAAEFRGLSADQPLDVTAIHSGATLTVSSGMSAPTSQPEELLIGAVGVLGSPDLSAASDDTHDLGFTAGAGYTVWSGSGTNSRNPGDKNVSIHPEYRIASAIGSYQANGALSLNARGSWTTLLAGYRADTTDHFLVTGPSTVTAGEPFVITVSATDSAGNTVTGYTGTVHLSSSDSAAISSLPTDVTFTTADQGVRQFTVRLFSAGAATITVRDTENSPDITGSASVQVSAAAATHFAVSAPASTIAGNGFTFTVTAQDQFNNVASGYAGTVHVTSSDSQAMLPANAALISGTGIFSADLHTAGAQTLTVTDTASATLTGSSSPIIVQNAAGVESVVINGADGAGVQRSKINSIVLTFSGLVTLDDGAITVLSYVETAPTAPEGVVVTTTTISDNGAPKTQATVRFTGLDIVGGSLPDGNYELLVDHLAVHFSNGQATPPADFTYSFYRLFGDSNGDRTVRIIDEAAFQDAIDSSSGQQNYLWYFDYDVPDDGNATNHIDVLDYYQFQLRFGTILPAP